jgi:hypothetical protein
MGAYNPDAYPPECTKIIKTVNRMGFRILKFAAKMDLRELCFHPGRETTRIDDILTIIERKVHILDIHTVPLESWVNQVQNLENMTQLEFCRIQSRNKETDAIFWTGISKLLNVTAIIADAVPLAPTLNLQFPHIMHLDLYLWSSISAVEWIYTLLDAVLKQFTSLERFQMYSFGGAEFILAAENLRISSVSCRNLREIYVSNSLPNGLLAVLGRDCAKLEICYYSAKNVDDEDLRQLSQCKNLRILQLKYSSGITSGLAYLTNNQNLETLDLHYSPARYIHHEATSPQFCPFVPTFENNCGVGLG